jgi:hypothetical protein
LTVVGLPESIVPEAGIAQQGKEAMKHSIGILIGLLVALNGQSQVLVFRFSGTSKHFRAGQTESTTSFKGFFYLDYAMLDGFSLYIRNVEGKKHFSTVYVLPLSQFKAESRDGTYTVLTDDGGVSPPNRMLELFHGADQSLPVSSQARLNFPRKLQRTITQFFPGTGATVESCGTVSSTYVFSPESTIRSNDSGLTLAQVLNQATQKLLDQGAIRDE